MAIVGLIVGLSAMGLRSAFNVNLRSSAGKLASTLRYLSQKAVTDHLYLRVVYDIEERRYSVEESKDSFLVPMEDLKSEPFPKKNKSSQNAEKPGASPEGSETAENKDSSGLVASSSIKPVTLPSGVFFKDFSVSYRQGKVEQGQAYTYFFPDGYATPTLIHLRNEDDDDHFSVEVSALSGQVKVFADYRDASEFEEHPEGGH